MMACCWAAIGSNELTRRIASWLVHNRLLLVCALGTTLAGCGPSQATVRGKITYRNQPVTSGEIHFIGEKGVSRSGLVNRNGSFEVHDVPVGQVKVAVVSYKSSGTPKPPKIGMKVQDPDEIVPRASAIPTTYNDVASSGLAFTISLGTQTIDIQLKDD